MQHPTRQAVSPLPTKRVRFAVETEETSSPSPLDRFDTEEEWRSIWYQQEELEQMRSEARELCRQMRILAEAATSLCDPDSPRLPTMAKDPLTRGLEQRSCLERQRRKFLANKFIVKAASKLESEPVKLAAIATRCTGWATDLAVEEAARDYFRAYSHAGKRSTPEPAPTRRVRARLAVIEA